jgi:hypothetical protein
MRFSMAEIKLSLVSRLFAAIIKRVHAYVGNESEFEGGAWASQTYEVFSRVDANVESECDDGARSTARQTEQ